MTRLDAVTLVGLASAAQRAGDIPAAIYLLAEAIDADPSYHRAWLWLSLWLTDPAEKRYCLDQVLASRPASAWARQQLAQLVNHISPMRPAALYMEDLAAFAEAGSI